MEGVGLGLRPIALEDRVAGIEYQFQSRNLLDQAKGVLGRKATPVRAVFMKFQLWDCPSLENLVLTALEVIFRTVGT